MLSGGTVHGVKVEEWETKGQRKRDQRVKRAAGPSGGSRFDFHGLLNLRFLKHTFL